MANRAERARLAKEIVAILENGFYIYGENQQKVDFAVDLKNAADNTILFKPEDLQELAEEKVEKIGVLTELEVTEESSLAAARRLTESGIFRKDGISCLNFASAKNAGGGFLNGSRAQEESLAMASGLYSSLISTQAKEYYDANRPTRGGMYKNYLIFSPGVPVLRDETTNEFLSIPYRLNFVTMPAVNATVAKKGHSMEEIESTMQYRMDCVLAVAAKQRQEALVLGAWGAGVFGNDPAFIAKAWRKFLVDPEAKFSGVFKKVTFAVLDFSKEKTTLNAFKNMFVV